MINQIIEQFKLIKHPEGGYYKEIIRSDEVLNSKNLPDRYDSSRNLYTSIYFLLTESEISKFHKLKSDEIWTFLSGDKLKLIIINEDGQLKEILLGNDFENDGIFQFKVKRNSWIAAETLGNYSFVSCIVIPGFEFEDFQLANRSELIKLYPRYGQIIKRYTND